MIERETDSRQRSRWLILAAATLSMMVIGLYQYSWTIFVTPLREAFGWSLDTVQLTFTLFVWIMTWTQPLAGYIADKKGPRLLVCLGGIISGVGWIATSFIDNPQTLYITYGLGGIGVGIIYATSVGLASKWFPDRRGLANGFTSFGYGFGAAILNPIISFIIYSLDFRTAFIYLGIAMLVILLGLSVIARFPPQQWIPDVITKKALSQQEYSPSEMIKSRKWWQIYTAFFLTASTGLMVTSQLTSMGQAFDLSANIILTATVAFPIFNGLGRLFGGYVSDRFGREVTMTLFFASQSISSLLLLLLGSIEIAFVIIICLIGLFWGPIFTFFPSIIADYFGRINSTTNYGITYTAKAWGGLIGGYVVAWLVTTSQSFRTPIMVSVVFGVTATALVFPKVLRKS